MKQQHNVKAYVGEYENNANDKAKRVILQSSLFDMRIGSHLTLGSSSETLAYNQAMSIGCSPLALIIYRLKYPTLSSTESHSS